MSDAVNQKLSSIPKHVAVIMDGNGRWATQKGLKRVRGHQKGVEAARTAVTFCANAGVEVLTLFAFSSENWKRPREEVSFLMELFLKAITREVGKLHERGVRLRFIGDRQPFAGPLVETMNEAEALTRDNGGLVLNIAVNYGGRWDMVQAARQVARSVQELGTDAAGITEDKLARHMSTAGQPDPDLLIRTGGERRISNFLLWQAAYSELYFCDTLWPDFGEDDWTTAFEDYARRQRRFGGVPEGNGPSNEIRGS
jgi:undecaprenyl diphosphate synthase